MATAKGDYYNPDLIWSMEGIGKIRPSFFNYANGYLKGCQEPPTVEIEPVDYVDGELKRPRGRNNVCGELMVRADNVWPTCREATVRPIQNGIVRDAFTLKQLELKSVPVSSSGSNRITLRATCSGQTDSQVVWLDRDKPSFDRVSVYSSVNAHGDTDTIVNAVQIHDDGYWLTSDYRIQVREDGVVSSYDGTAATLDLEEGTHTVDVRIEDGCGRRSGWQTVEFGISAGGYVVEPGFESESDCEDGEELNGRGECVEADCNADLGWIFDPSCGAGKGCCTCAPSGHPDYDPTCLY